MAKLAYIKMDVDTKRLAEVYALVAQTNRIMIRVEGMKALNTQREIVGSSLGYDEEAFEAQENCLALIVEALVKIASQD